MAIRRHLNGEREMINFRLSPQMKALIEKAKANGGATACDPRAMYPMGHKCAATKRPIPYVKLQPLPPIKSTGVTIDPYVQRALDHYKKIGHTPTALDLQRFAASLRRIEAMNKIADTAALVKQRVPTRDGGAVTRIETATDEVTAKTDANGAVTEVEVKPKTNVLIPLALGAAALILLGG